MGGESGGGERWAGVGVRRRAGRLTKLEVSVFEEAVEYGGEDESGDPRVVVGEVDDPGDACTHGDHQPVEGGLRQVLLDRLDQTHVLPLAHLAAAAAATTHARPANTVLKSACGRY